MRIFKKFPFILLSLSGYAVLNPALVNIFDAAIAQPASANESSTHRHSLLIFAPDMLSKALAKQLAAFDNKQDDLEVREISLVYVVGKTASAQLGSYVVAPAVRLRAHYQVGADEFRTILADEHGGIELVSDVPITAAQLFETTDAVPVTHEAQR